jgi:formamidopyrimidine-DNA glycosylase
MPELPEVETVRRYLASHLSGRRIVSVFLRRPDLRFPFPEQFSERLEGIVLRQLVRRGKYLVGELSSGETLVAHLGMSGRFTLIWEDTQYNTGLFYHKGPAKTLRDHVIFTFEGGITLLYNDPRRFGFMDIVGSHWEESRHFKQMGIEPLSKALHADWLLSRLAGRKASLRQILLDQRHIAGLGNIYVCEALFRSRLHPERPSASLTKPEAIRLVQEIVAVLEEAILAGGSTLRDFAGADGHKGDFQQQFFVYGRNASPCLTPGCTASIERRILAGRSSFFCASCQS